MRNLDSEVMRSLNSKRAPEPVKTVMTGEETAALTHAYAEIESDIIAIRAAAAGQACRRR